MKKYKFTIRGHKYDVEIQSFEDNIAEIEVNGTKYQVELDKMVKQSKTPKLTRTRVPSPTRKESKIEKKVSKKSYTINAPLPGTIFKIFAKEGDEVKEGDNLLIMEAMKMENNVLAEKPGIIKNIKVKEGDAVLQNDVLIEMG